MLLQNTLHQKISIQTGVAVETVKIILQRKPLRAYTYKEKSILVSKCIAEISMAYNATSANSSAIAETEKMIIENFKQYDTDEIKLAFRLAAAGKLAFGKDQSEVNFYHFFNPSVFGKVLAAYFEYRKAVIRAIEKENQILLQSENENHKKSPEYLAKIDIEIWQKIVFLAQKTDIQIDEIPEYFYDWLIDKNEMTPTKERKAECYNAAKNFIETQGGKIREKNATLILEWRNLSDVSKSDKIKNQSITLAKKMLIHDFLQQIKENA